MMKQRIYTLSWITIGDEEADTFIKQVLPEILAREHKILQTDIKEKLFYFYKILAKRLLERLINVDFKVTNNYAETKDFNKAIFLSPYFFLEKCMNKYFIDNVEEIQKKKKKVIDLNF